MTDADYEFGQAGEERPFPDNRADYRLTATALAILELESTVPELSAGHSETEAPGRELVCRIRDISARGMSLYSREPLSLGALLPASVAIGEPPQSFGLMVEVVWCRPSESGFLVGAQIVQSDGTDYVEWVEAVAIAMAAE